MTRSNKVPGNQVRRTVNLTPEEAASLDAFLEPGTPEREELAAFVGEEALPYSHSGVLGTLVELGARALRDRVEERAYREMAGSGARDDTAIDEFIWDSAQEALRED